MPRLPSLAVLLLALLLADAAENSTSYHRLQLTKPPASHTSPLPAARWEDEEDYGQELPPEDASIEESDEETAEEEDEHVFVLHTTQRSKGDSGKRRRPTYNKKKANKLTRKGYKGSKGVKGLKKLKKYMFPLLIAYKLKFFTLIPLLLGGLVLIVATTGFAGFFFALFAVGVGLKKD